MNEAAEIINQTVPSNYIYDPTRQVYVTIKTVTPEVAKELLEGQIKNRPISKAVVRKYKDCRLYTTDAADDSSHEHTTRLANRRKTKHRQA